MKRSNFLAAQCVIEFLRLPGKELLALRVGDEHGAGNAARDFRQLVFLYRAKNFVIGGGSIRAHASTEHHLGPGIFGRGHFHHLVERGFLPVAQHVAKDLWDIAKPGFRDIPAAGIGHAGRDAVFESQRAGYPIFALSGRRLCNRISHEHEDLQARRAESRESFLDSRPRSAVAIGATFSRWPSKRVAEQ